MAEVKYLKQFGAWFVHTPGGNPSLYKARSKAEAEQMVAGLNNGKAPLPPELGGPAQDGGNSGYVPGTGPSDASVWIGGPPPKTKYSRPYVKATQRYIDNMKWKRQQLKALLEKYRTELPGQIEAYKTSAYGGLPEREKQAWGTMYTNLNQRGLDESPGFLGGARQDFENWRLGERQSIEDTAQAMKQQGQQAMLSALGQPNFGNVQGLWGQHNQQLNDWIFNQWKNRKAASG